jgi:hypothetical protein
MISMADGSLPAKQNQRRSFLASLWGACMLRILKVCKLNNKYFPAFGFIAILLAIAVNMAIAAQDKYTVTVPGGLAFSEFRGYEDWQSVSVSKTEHAFAIILANPVMMGGIKHFGVKRSREKRFS